MAIGAKSPNTLYDPQLASFSMEGYDVTAARGFIDLFGLPMKVAARRESGDAMLKCAEAITVKAPTQPYHYQGLLHCGECGCFITRETDKGYNYARCTKRSKRNCSHPFVREERIAEQIQVT